MNRPTHVLVGGGLAAAKAAEAARAAGFDGRLVLVADEDALPYERPELSKGYLKGTTTRAKLDVHETGWYAEHDVEPLLGVTATGLDLAARTVALSDRRSLDWDRLLFATGASPRRLAVPGAERAGVHYLRTVDDADALEAALGHGGHVVVVGAGWIGLEVAAAARHYGALVTVLEAAPTPLHAVLGPELGEVFAQLHRGNGVDVRAGVGVRELTGDARVRAVVLDDGSALPADAVVVGIGVRPNTELAEQAGLPVDDGVLADETLRSLGHPDVFAAGDVARFASPVYGATMRVEHWANAANQGGHAGRALAGSSAAYTKVPYFWTDQFGLSMEYHGWVGPAGYDAVVLRGEDEGEDDESMEQFIAFWLRDGRVRAAMNVNVWDQTDAIKALVRAQAAADPAALADPSTDLATIAPTPTR